MCIRDRIKECDTPLYGICFGHQIICKVLGGEVVRAEEKTERMMKVKYNGGKIVNQLFTHQDHVIDAGEMEVIASSDHCNIVACVHPTREIKTVQFHPEACLLYTSPSPRDRTRSRMPSSA